MATERRVRGPGKEKQELTIVPPRPHKVELVARIARLKEEVESRPPPTIVKLPGKRYLPGGFREYNSDWMIKELSNGDRVYMVRD